MGLFDKRKEKKNKEANSANRQQILSILGTAKLSCRDADTVAAIRKIEAELQTQSETSSAEVIRIDSEIKQLLTEANGFILKQQYPIALTKLNKAFDRAVDRHQYCYAGGAAVGKPVKTVDVKIEKTRAEQLQDEIDKKTQELAGFEKQFEQLRALHAQNPGNASINAQATALKTKIVGYKNDINSLTTELSREMTADVLVNTAAVNESLEKGRTHTQEEMDVVRANIQASVAERAATQEQTNQDLELLGVGAAATSAFDPFAEDSSFGMADPFGDSVAATGTAAQGQAAAGGIAASMGTKDMAKDIQSTTKALEKSLETYNDKIEDANDELADYNAQLRPLLMKRKDASPSDCLILDGQIDQINAKRSAVTYQIKAYRQQAAVINDKLSIIRKLEVQNDLAATNASIAAATGGKLTDYAELSMFLQEAVQKSNEALEEINIAASVADSEDIMMNSASGISAQLSDATVVKDEDKYAALQQELGLQI